MSLVDVSTIHGADERISIENLQRAVKFYQQLIVGASGQTLVATCKHASALAVISAPR